MVIFVFIAAIVLVMILVAWIIYVPVWLFIDTDRDRYELVQRGTLFVAVHPRQLFRTEVRLFGIRMPKVAAFRKNEKKEKEPEQKSARRKTRGFKRSSAAWIFLVRNALKSFRLRRLVADVDTDDVVLNARLVPFMLLASRGPVSLTVNFYGRVYLCLELEGRLNKLLWVFFRFLIKK